MKQGHLFTRRYKKVVAPEPSEAEIQKALVSHLWWRHREWEDKVIWWHTPNGGWRHKITAMALKAMGVLPGVADLIFLQRDLNDLSFVLFLELKSKKGKQSASQLRFADSVLKLKFAYEVAHSLDEALAILKKYAILN